MPRLIVIVAAAGAHLLAAGVANGQSTSGTSVGGTPSPQPGVTVQGPERMVCRVVRRTGTRMRSSRVCRTVREWDEAHAGRSQDEVLADAAQTLDVLGEAPTTLCQGGELEKGFNGRTPLGPR